MTQFGRAVGLEVSLDSYGLLEELLSRACGSGPVDVCGPFRKTICSSMMSTTVVPSVASRSWCSLSTVTDLTVTSGGGINAIFRPNLVTESNFSPLTEIAAVVNPQDVSLTVLAQQDRLKFVSGKKKPIGQCGLSREGRPN